MAISGDIRCFVQAANGDLLAGVVDSAKIFKSTDDGVTWTLVQTLGSVAADTVRAFAKFHPFDALYAAVTSASTNRGIWRSTDNGDTWTKIRTFTGASAFSDDGYWDLYAVNGFMAVVGKDTQNSRNIVVEILDGGLTWHTMPNVASSSVLNYSNPPYAVTRSPHWGDTYSFLSKTNLFATQVARFHPLNNGAIANLLPTSSMGAHSSATAGWRDLDQFTWTDDNGRVRHYLMSAAYRSISPAGTEIWIVDDNIGGSGPADYFAKIATINDTLRAIYPDPADIVTPGQYTSYPRERTVWGAGNGQIWVSYNKGYTWQIATNSPVNQMWALIRTSAGTLIAGGDSAEVFRYTGVGGPGGGGGDPGGGGGEDPGGEEPGGETGGGGDTGPFLQNTAILGREATTTGLTAVSNKIALSNVTHIFNYDGASFTTLQFENNPPYTFFDATPAVGDIVYFGSRTADPDVPNGPFTSLVFNLIQAAQDISGWVWEYWDGSAWSTLSVTDNTNGFAEPGENSVHWAAPSDWAITTVNGADGYWVRIRITGVESDPMPPIHSGRFVYTINLPFVEIAQREIEGNLPALMRTTWRNLADSDDIATSLPADRFVVGLRSVDRGPNFLAYLNVSDVHTPFGVTVTNTLGSFAANITAPTGRVVTHQMGGGSLNAWQDVITFQLDNTVAADYYGVFRAFLRVQQAGGSAQQWRTRLKVAFGSGGGASYSKEAFIQAGGVFETLDLGRIAIPDAGIVATAQFNLGDYLSIVVQGYATSSTPTITFYDLILIPMDEWAIAVQGPDVDAATGSEVGIDDYLDIDSITNPKEALAAYARTSANLMVSRYQTIGSSEAILQRRKRQRLWFLAMAWSASNYWVSYPYLAGAVTVEKVQRYKSMRGDR